MQELYELSGVAPSMWTGDEGHIYFSGTQGAVLMAQFWEVPEDTTLEDNYYPYYTLDDVLEQLPLSKHDAFFLRLSRYDNGQYVVYYGRNTAASLLEDKFQEDGCVREDMLNDWEFVADSWLIAALQMWKKQIKEEKK